MKMHFANFKAKQKAIEKRVWVGCWVAQPASYYFSNLEDNEESILDDEEE